MADDPKWPRASAWLAGDHDPKPVGRLGVIGAPLRMGSLTPGHTDLAPAAIRAALDRFSTYDVETGADVRRLEATDFGDLDLAGARPEDALAPISEAIRKGLADADALALLGGDNSVTRPGVHGLGDLLHRSGLLTIDAHFDLRDLESGLSNGNPVRALLQDGLPGDHVVQIGIQPFANSAVYAGMARDAGVSVVTIDAVRMRGIEAVVLEGLGRLAERCEAIYVNLDLDVLDRAFAPATPGSRPGGLSPWEARRAAQLCGRDPNVRVIDLVEVDPTKDVADTTILAAAECLLSFASGLLTRLDRK